jgi:cell division septum initiation protein DivIVA
VDAQSKVAEIRQIVANARSMPMSASAVINREEMIAHLDELAQLIYGALSDRQAWASETDVYRLAQGEADKVLNAARREADALRRETDSYVDERLANFELTLQKTMEAVARGRDRLRGRSDLDEAWDEPISAKPLPDPFAE